MADAPRLPVIHDVDPSDWSDLSAFCSLSPGTMKLALVRRGYSGTGGAEAYLKRFAGALAEAGHTPVLYTCAAWPAAEWPFELRRVAHGRSPAAFARAIETMDPHRECDVVFSLERVWACDCFRAGDGVHAASLARRAQEEVFLKPLFRSLRPKHRQLLALEQALLRDRKARAVIVNSRMVAREIIEYFAYPPEQIHLVYNGVPPAMPEAEQQRARAEVRRSLGLGDDQYVLLFAGSGWERKGLAHAIQAVEHSASRPRLLVAGSGTRGQMPPSSLTRYLGPMPGLGRTLAAVDGFILPTGYDPFSNACLEAMAAGLPVITSAANGFAEIIDADEGSTVENPADIDALAAAIDKWSSAPRRAAVRACLQAKGAQFSMERNLAETLRVLETLAAK